MKTKSVITTTFGSLVGICGIGQFLYYLLDGNPGTTADLNLLITMLTSAGLIAAKDFNATHAKNNPDSTNEMESKGD